MQVAMPKATDDVLLHHVSLQRVSGISVAFATGFLQAILPITSDPPDFCLFPGLDTHAVWTHLPLSSEEKIEGVWAVYRWDLQVCALVVGSL